MPLSFRRIASPARQRPIKQRLGRAEPGEEADWVFFDPSEVMAERERLVWYPGQCSWASRLASVAAVSTNRPGKGTEASDEVEPRSSETVSEQDECPICLAALFRPVKTTRCEHSFCEPCWARCVSAHTPSVDAQSGSRCVLRCPLCRGDTGAERTPELDAGLRQRYPQQWAAREAEPEHASVSATIACPRWHADAKESELALPPCVQVSLAGALRPLEIEYTCTAGLHRLAKIGGYEIHNFTVVQMYTSATSVNGARERGLCA